MTLIERLSSYTLRTNEGDVLDDYNRRTFLNFVSEFLPLKGKRIVYRGDSFQNIKSQFNEENIDNHLLSHYIFVMGTKARACWDMTPILMVGNTEPKNFNSILHELREALKGFAKGSPSRVRKMKNFVSANKNFCHEVMNNSTMIELNYQRLDDDDKVFVNLFYLTLLHTLNSNGFGHRSTFLSTTTNYYWANRFAKDIIFFGWYPTTGDFGRNGGRIINECHGVMYKGIPLSTPAYVEQNEISLRCGLLPHFMIGYKMKVTDDFYVNPALINAANSGRAYKDIIENGFYIDQSSFADLCRSSNFHCYFTVCEGHYELHKL